MYIYIYIFLAQLSHWTPLDSSAFAKKCFLSEDTTIAIQRQQLQFFPSMGLRLTHLNLDLYCAFMG